MSTLKPAICAVFLLLSPPWAASKLQATLGRWWVARGTAKPTTSSLTVFSCQCLLLLTVHPTFNSTPFIPYPQSLLRSSLQLLALTDTWLVLRTQRSPQPLTYRLPSLSHGSYHRAGPALHGLCCFQAVFCKGHAVKVMLCKGNASTKVLLPRTPVGSTLLSLMATPALLKYFLPLASGTPDFLPPNLFFPHLSHPVESPKSSDSHTSPVDTILKINPGSDHFLLFLPLPPWSKSG